MKYALCLIAILSGYLSVRLLPTSKDFTIKNTEQIEDSKKCLPGNELSPETNKLNTVYQFKCLPMIANAGILRTRGQAKSRALIENLFVDGLREFEDPNEFNVRTNKNAPGKSAQKYDPRDDLYIRFTKTDKWDKKRIYGVFESKKDFLKTVTDSKCQPEFSKIEDYSEIRLFQELRKKEFIIPRRPAGDDANTKFSFLMLLSWFSRMDDNSILTRYKSFRNSCSCGISYIVNFCINDPRYDLEYEDLFLVEDEGKQFVGSKIYCKSTNQASWIKIRESIYKL